MESSGIANKIRVPKLCVAKTTQMEENYRLVYVNSRQGSNLCSLINIYINIIIGCKCSIVRSDFHYDGGYPADL